MYVCRKAYNKAPKFAPIAALTPRDGNKTRRALARRYMFVYIRDETYFGCALYLDRFGNCLERLSIEALAL